MPIYNKGRLILSDVSIRQAGNDWPTAQVISTSDVVENSANLYFTNARVIAALSALTTANISEVSSNLYFSNTRVFSAIADGSSSLYVGNTTASTSKTTGALTVAGGVGISNDLTVGNSIKVDGGAYGNVITTQFASVFGAATGPNPYSIMQVRSSDDVSGIGMQAFSGSGTLYGNAVINFALAKIRDRDIPSSLVIKANIDSAGLTVFGNVNASTVQATKWNGLYTANVVETSGNLYFSNARARSAFTAGRGIILMSDGTIKSTIGTETFNTGIDGGRSYPITTSMNGITFTSSNAGDRLILRSLHVTNVTDNPAYVSSNVLYAGGNTAYLGNLIPVPVGSIVEFMDRPQIIQPNDTINLQAFDQNQTPANNILQAYFTYETVINDTTYVGTGHTLATSNANILITTADQSDTVFESIKFVNLKPYSIGVKTFFGDPNGIPRSYLAYNLQVPPNSSVEVLQSPKLLKFLDTLYVSYANASNGDAIAVFPSYRRTAVTTPYASTSSAVAQGSIQAAFNTTIIDGSTLYYTLE
jgi:hypothetical protein